MTEASTTSPARGGAFQQWYMVGALTLVYALSFIDRSALNIVIEPIRHDLHITDVQMSLLIGISFVSMYTLMSIPAGYIVDLFSRRVVIAGGVVVWSGASIVAAFAGNFWQLFAGRAGLGAGEAALPPAAYSMMKDGVDEASRGRAFATYQAGVNLGYGLGAFIGGAIFAAATAGVFTHTPLLRELKSWQLVVLLPALFGLLVAALMFTVREPGRARTVDEDAATFPELFRHLRVSWRLYALIFAAMVTVSLGGSGWNAWMATSLVRTWGLSPGSVGQVMGLIGLFMFPFATFALGYIMDLFRKRGFAQAPFWVAIGGCLCNLGPALLIQNAPSIPVMWTAYVLSILFSTSGVQVACGMMLAEVTPGRLMGKMTSFYYMVINLLAAGSGPTIMAMVSQYGFHGPRAISHAMTLCYAVFILATVLLLMFGSRQFRRWRGTAAAAEAAA